MNKDELLNANYDAMKVANKDQLQRIDASVKDIVQAYDGDADGVHDLEDKDDDKPTVIKKSDILAASMDVMKTASKDELEQIQASIKSIIDEEEEDEDTDVGSTDADDIDTTDLEERYSVNVDRNLRNILEAEGNFSRKTIDKISTLFEAAINSKAKQHRARLDESNEDRFQDAIKLVESKVNSYLQYVVEEWMLANEIALESSIKAESASELLEGLKQVFIDNNFNIPENEECLVQKLSEERDSIESRLNNKINENLKLREQIDGYKLNSVFESFVHDKDLTYTDKERFISLVEDFEFVNEEHYSEKLETVYESHFGNAPKHKTETIRESYEFDDDDIDSSETTKDILL